MAVASAGPYGTGIKKADVKIATILLTIGLVCVIVSLQLLAYGTLNTVVFINDKNNNAFPHQSICEAQRVIPINGTK